MKKAFNKLKQFIYPSITATPLISCYVKPTDIYDDKILEAYVLYLNDELEKEEVKFYVMGDFN